jgi:hypothetical protein
MFPYRYYLQQKIAQGQSADIDKWASVASFQAYVDEVCNQRRAECAKDLGSCSLTMKVDRITVPPIYDQSLGLDKIAEVSTECVDRTCPDVGHVDRSSDTIAATGEMLAGFSRGRPLELE